MSLVLARGGRRDGSGREDRLQTGLDHLRQMKPTVTDGLLERIDQLKADNECLRKALVFCLEYIYDPPIEDDGDRLEEVRRLTVEN